MLGNCKIMLGNCKIDCGALKGGQLQGDALMPQMTDNRRKKIQARQLKAENALKREAKIAKKARNAAKAKKAG